MKDRLSVSRIVSILLCTALLCTLIVLPQQARAESEKQRMLQNLSTSPTLGDKRTHAVDIANALFDRGYEPAFIAGFIANFIKEGDFGVFECLNYSESTRLSYVRHMHGWDYDEGHWDTYGKYSFYTCRIWGNDKNGDPVSLSEVAALVDQLIAEGHTTAIFGLGCIQWTYYSRLRGLIRMYQQYAAEDHMTEDECIRAELAFMLQELGGSYSYVYKNWKAECAEELNSADAAYRAGYRICKEYEIPGSASTACEVRGNVARNIYADMITNTSLEGDISQPVASLYTEKTGPAAFCVFCEAFDDTGVTSFTVTVWNDIDGAENALVYTVPVQESIIVSECVAIDIKQAGGRVNTAYHVSVFARDAAGNYSPQEEADPVFIEPDYTGLNAFILPEGISSIQAQAFSGTKAQVIFFPAGTITVEGGAFEECRQLMYIVIPTGASVSLPASFTTECQAQVIYQ